MLQVSSRAVAHAGQHAFFRYARERYRIHLLRQLGEEREHWTGDPILHEYRFCNVFREDDRTTIWFRDNIREPLRNDARALLATVVFRWFNRIETCSILHGDRDGVPTTDLFRQWSARYARNRLEGVSPLVTGAYIIKTPPGMDKLTGVLKCIEDFRRQAHPFGPDGLVLRQSELAWLLLGEPERHSLQHVHEWLCNFPYLGPFMAYEIVTDLRHTALLEHAKDIDTWASPGPGAARGLGRVYWDNRDMLNYSSAKDRRLCVSLMQDLLELANARSNAYWPSKWPRWEMREVEHTLCEFDKYERARKGQGRPKQRYGESHDTVEQRPS